MKVYRVVRCQKPTGESWFCIKKFGLREYVKLQGIRQCISEYKSGWLSFNPMKLRGVMRKHYELQKWYAENYIKNKLKYAKRVAQPLDEERQQANA